MKWLRNNLGAWLGVSHSSGLIKGNTKEVNRDGKESIFSGPANLKPGCMYLNSYAVDHIALFKAEKTKLRALCSKGGETSYGYLVFCGDAFFEGRLDIERAEYIGRPVRHGFEDFSIPIEFRGIPVCGRTAWFRGDQDLIYYISFGSEMANGEQVVEEHVGYMVPAGIEDLENKPHLIRQLLATEEHLDE